MPQKRVYDESEFADSPKKTYSEEDFSAPAEQPKPSLMQRIGEYLPSRRTALQMTGAGVGGFFGTAGGPLGTVAGGALGAGAGESLEQLIERVMGENAPQTSTEAVGRIGEAASGGALQEGIGYGLNRGSQALATKLYRSALKPPTNMPVEQAAEVTQNLLNERIATSARGAGKLGSRIENLSGIVDREIATKPGATLDPFSVASRVDPSIQQFGYKDLQKDLTAAAGEKGRFVREHSTPIQYSPYNPAQTAVPPVQTYQRPNPIPAARGQAMKKAIYQEVYPVDTPSGYKVARQQEGRGLKEDLEALFPQIGPTNERLGRLLEAQPYLESAANRASNKDLVPGGIMAAIKKVSPSGSRTAILLERLRKAGVLTAPKFGAIPTTRSIFDK